MSGRDWIGNGMRPQGDIAQAGRNRLAAAAVVGELVALADGGEQPLVLFPGAPGPAAQPARTTVELRAEHLGAGVVMVFEDGDSTRPIVIGVLHHTMATAHLASKPQVDLDADGRCLTVRADQRLTLRCGAASITLTRAGKVLIEGEYVLSRAAGVNRIQGAAVQIN